MTDLGLDKYLDSLDAEYLSEINADDYAQAIKVEAFPAKAVAFGGAKVKKGAKAAKAYDKALAYAHSK